MYSEKNKKNSGLFRSFYISAKAKLEKGLIREAYYDFAAAEDIFGCAYCRFLKGDIKGSEALLKQVYKESPAAAWIFFLINLLTGRKSVKPSYFQIRNFYEPVMNMLVKCGNLDFADRILRNIDYLAQYNLEIYKHTARVFLDNGMASKSFYYLRRSTDICYNDPEAHFMLAEAYIEEGNIKEAELEYIKADETGNGYYPAVKRLKELEQKQLRS